MDHLRASFCLEGATEENLDTVSGLMDHLFSKIALNLVIEVEYFTCGDYVLSLR